MSYTRFSLSPVSLLLLLLSAPFLLSFCPTPDEYFNLGEKAIEEKDYTAALAHYTKAAEAGHAEAMYRIGNLTFSGKLAAPDTCAAVGWIRKAAEAGSVDGECDYGLCLILNYCSKDRGQEGLEWIRKAIDHGSAKAQYIMGWLFYSGYRSGNIDYDQAFHWFKESARQGYAEGMVYLGYCYYSGLGTDKDHPTAVEWFTKAAELGNTDGMYSLASCLQHGEGIPADKTRAYELFQKAAEAGHRNAMYSLAWCYQNGEGTPIDLPKATEWFRKAAEAGHVDAMVDYGYACEIGRGITKNIPEAVVWYRRAAEGGQRIGQYNLANCYLRSIGVNQNLDNAETWARKSLNNGYQPAQKLLDEIAALRKKPKKEDDDDWDPEWWEILRYLRFRLPEESTQETLRPLGYPEMEFRMRRIDPRRLYKPNGQPVGYGPEFHPNGWMPQLLEKPGIHPLLGAFYSSRSFTYGKGIKEYDGRYLNDKKVRIIQLKRTRAAQDEYESGFRINNDYGLIMNLNEPIVDGKMTPFTINLEGFGWVRDTYGVLHKKSTRPGYMHAHSIVKVLRVIGTTAWVAAQCLRSGQIDYVRIQSTPDGISWKNIGMISPAHKGAPCHLCHGYGREEILRRYDKQIKAAAKEYSDQKRHIVFGGRNGMKYIASYDIKKVQPLADNGVRLYIAFQYDRVDEDNFRTSDLMRYDVYTLPDGKLKVLPPVSYNNFLTLETQVNLFESWQ